MPFNSDDFTKAPWTNGVMTLTNDECVSVKGQCDQIKEDYKDTSNPEPSVQYVVSKYNEIDWRKAINGDTFETLERYDPEVNTQGISPEFEKGIVPEPTPEEPTEEPTETPEEPTEGETSPDEENPPNEPETAPADEEQTEEA